MRRGLAVLAVVLGGCGIRGLPPEPRAPAPVRALRVEGRAGAVRVSWIGRPGAADSGARRFDVLRRGRDDASNGQPAPEERVWFEKIGSVPAAGAARYFYFDEDVEPGRTYDYRVRARRHEGSPASGLRYSGPEEAISWETPPPAPANVSARALHRAVRISWDPVEEATGYRVYPVDESGEPFPEPAHGGILDRTQWVALGLKNAEEVRYVVRSLKEVAPPPAPDPTAPPEEPAARRPFRTGPEAPSAAEVGTAAAHGISIPPPEIPAALKRAGRELSGQGALPGIESESSEVVAATPGLTPPAPPPRLVKAASTSEGIAVSWRPSTGEQVVGYHVFRRKLGRGNVPISPEWNRRTEEPVNATGWIDSKVEKGATYEYQVRAVDAAGTLGSASTPSLPQTHSP